MLAPPIAFEPEARIIVDDLIVANPAALHDVMASRANNGIVRTAPKDSPKKLGENPTTAGLAATRSAFRPPYHVHVKESPTVPICLRDVGVRALKVRHAFSHPVVALIEDVGEWLQFDVWWRSERRRFCRWWRRRWWQWRVWRWRL